MSPPRALITGASSGIGACFAEALAARGHPLVLVARRADRLDALRAALPTDAEVLAADLLDPAGLAAVEARVAVGDIGLLVNNAGIGPPGRFADQDPARVGEVIALNIVALTRLTHAALGPMRARRAGAIVQIASLAAFQPNPGFAVYGATKSYVLALSEAVHEEVKADGVQVLTVCPGFTHTGFQEANGAHVRFLPSWMWSEPDQVVRATLARLNGRTAVLVPAWHDRIAAQLTGWLPRVAVRRVAGWIGLRVGQ